MIRQLRPGEVVPTGEPRRYRSSHGYIRLRWRVAPNELVEAYEHRIVAGTMAPEVHHRNGLKDDNRPENLVSLSTLEHAAEHSSVDYVEASQLYRDGWSLPMLAKRYGVGNVTIMRSLKLRGVQMRTLKEACKAAWQRPRKPYRRRSHLAAHLENAL